MSKDTDANVRVASDIDATIATAGPVEAGNSSAGGAPGRLQASIAISSFALVGTVISIVIAFQSLKVSKASLSLVQRAYVTVRPISFHVDGLASKAKGGEKSLRIIYEVNNLGNTPALNVRIDRTILLPNAVLTHPYLALIPSSHMYEGKYFSPPNRTLVPIPQASVTIPNTSFQLGPKSTMTITVQTPISDQLVKAFREEGRMDEVCTYTDTFGVDHKIKWTCKLDTCTNPMELQ